uniref:Delta(3,5)-Delta(2,4)-dienoyl-CoA isomerase, mitochondrial n=1 Tax=Steinernema glaseri TaxID=37863 RepID=A0A1I7ZUK5_9BILA
MVTHHVRSVSTVPKCNFIDVSSPSEHVFHVQLNRPDRRNAFTLELWKELRAVFDHLSTYSKCRSIVLSGAGKSFCAGIDLQDGVQGLMAIIQDQDMDVARKSRKLRDLINACQSSFSAPEKCVKPVIGAIHSHCIGAGINLVASCDIRYASSDSIFSIREVDIGLAADVGILNRINKLVGNDSLTRELAYTARDINASQALQYGLVSRVFDTKESCFDASLELAKEIASKSPIAVQGSKIALNYARDHSVDDSINFLLTWNQSQLQSEDLVKSAMAAMSKQKPEFKDV